MGKWNLEHWQMQVHYFAEENGFISSYTYKDSVLSHKCLAYL